ncbi:peptide ABC transporter substrate-binding protein [Rhizobium leguminosarum]|uniref:peptide ABC transporter substrate-binding protein n=1 Tax=Rhizobium leguminosarum TaxID=384 RepID=UPI001CDB6E35|nr:peptide ABC transporter substrate-binding protein [Rhizobium leguminosarum]MCA2411280.1 peptide ABC transporter substrate-binding protein [Rhizobium leguminosarum]
MSIENENTKFTLTRRSTLRLLGAAGVVSYFAPNLLGKDRALAAPPSKPTGQLIVGFSQEPTVFNPHKLHLEVDEGIQFALFDTLFVVNAEGIFEPSLAVEVPTVANGGVSEDGLNWRIKLRDDVKWHDGKLFTAEDVKFTLELLVDPKFNSWRRTGHQLIRDLTVVSPTELTWRMERPFAPYPSILAATFIVAAHAFDGVADKNSAPIDSAPIGTGPFQFVSRRPGDSIEVVANHDYFGEGPYIEKVVFRYIPDQTVLYTQFTTGDIDLISISYIPPDKYKAAQALAGKAVELMPASSIECIAFNTGRAPLDEQAVRQAIYYAFDRDAALEQIYSGVPLATESYMPQQSFYYNPDLPKHEFDLEKAKQLLDAAGWVPEADGIRVKNGQRLSFTNSTTAGNYVREQVQQYLQQTLREVGIEMNIENMPAAVLFADFWLKSQFHSIMHGQDYLTGSDPDTSDFFLSTNSAAKGGGGLNFWQYANPEVDRLLGEGGKLFVPEERKPIYAKIQEIVRNDLPFITMWQRRTARGHKDGLNGYAGNVNVRIDTWNIGDWYWS